MLTQSLGVKEPFAVWEGRLKGPVGGGKVTSAAVHYGHPFSFQESLC